MLPEDVAAGFSRYWAHETLAERLSRVVAANAGRTAVVDGATSSRFEEIWVHACGLAGWFRAHGVGPGDVVSWQLPNWWEAVVVHHAAIVAGAISNPVDPAFRARELKHIAAVSRPKVMVAPQEFRGFVYEELTASLGVPEVLFARGGTLERAMEHEPVEALAADPAAPAVLLYTSGTTSLPKGVLHSHRALLCEIDSFTDIHALTPEDRYLAGAPFGHIAGLVYGVMTPFALGTSAVLLDRWDPARAAATGATFMTGPPTFLLTLADRAREPMPGFRLFSTGGASIPTEAVREAGRTLGCTVKRAYGSTELPTLTATRMDDDEHARLETDGRPIGGAEIRIEEGQIWARAPEMFIGYADGTPALSGGWFATGDAGVLEPDGLLHVTGRIGDLIIRGGENISPKEIEDLLLEHPAVADVAVVGFADARLGERVAAFIVTRDGSELGLHDVTSFLREREIAVHKLPEKVLTVASLPKTESGKTLKAQLRAMLA